MNEINTSTSKLSLNDVIVFALKVKTALTTELGSIYFAAVTPSVSDLDEAILSCEVAAGKETSKSVTILRHDRRANLADILTRMGMSCMLIANGNIEMLAHSGFPFRKTTEHSQLPPGAPGDLKLKKGPLSGTVFATCDRPAHVDTLELQSGADGDVGPWMAAGIFTSSRNMEVTGLTPGQHLWVRVRGVGTNGPGDWSDPATIMVV